MNKKYRIIYDAYTERYFVQEKFWFFWVMVKDYSFYHQNARFGFRRSQEAEDYLKTIRESRFQRALKEKMRTSKDRFRVIISES